tara:strand:+ start:4178 stop:4633 length:456 start_codon:yes stop_codon:yes gene_type:complete
MNPSTYSPLFHNNTVNINDVWFESHKSLLQQLCVELGHTDKISEMSDKFLGPKLKMKAFKDPNKPKRARSAYFYFCDDERSGVITKHRTAAKKKEKKGGDGKINMGDVAKEVAEIWKKVTEDEKKKYLDLAETDKERYATAMSVFNEKNGY